MDINRDTAAWSMIGPTNAGGNMNGIAYDAVHNLLYGINPASDQLFTINLGTGAATAVGAPGSLGYSSANGLAYDPVAEVLYATDNSANQLFRINVSTGVGTAVATISGGFSQIEGLGYDPFTRTLYGLTQLQQRVVKIDTTTGLATPLPAQLPEGVWRGLDFDWERRQLFATAVSANSLLYRIDVDTGAPTLVGTLVNGGFVQGLAFVPEPGAAMTCAGGLALSALRRRRSRA